MKELQTKAWRNKKDTEEELIEMTTRRLYKSLEQHDIEPDDGMFYAYITKDPSYATVGRRIKNAKLELSRFKAFPTDKSIRNEKGLSLYRYRVVLHDI